MPDPMDMDLTTRRLRLKRTGGEDREDKKKQPFICDIPLKQQEDGSLVSIVLDEAIDTFGPHLLLHHQHAPGVEAGCDAGYDAGYDAAAQSIKYEHEFCGLNFNDELDAIKFIVVAKKVTGIQGYHFRPAVQDRHGRRDSELWGRMVREDVLLVRMVHCRHHSDTPRLVHEIRDALGSWLKFFRRQFAVRSGWTPGTRISEESATPHSALRWRREAVGMRTS
tara:strand:+ start:6001 stop:6666 length:666 start_codon:yes stop_codon:yes gene_type:complete